MSKTKTADRLIESVVGVLPTEMIWEALLIARNKCTAEPLFSMILETEISNAAFRLEMRNKCRMN